MQDPSTQVPTPDQTFLDANGKIVEGNPVPTLLAPSATTVEQLSHRLGGPVPPLAADAHVMVWRTKDGQLRWLSASHVAMCDFMKSQLFAASANLVIYEGRVSADAINSAITSAMAAPQTQTSGHRTPVENFV